MYATEGGEADLFKPGVVTGASGAAAAGLIAASRLQNPKREFCDSLVAADVGVS